MINTLRLVAGERRRVTVRVTYNGRQSGFTVGNPRYVLKSGYKEIEGGIPALNYNTEMTVIIEPPQAGNYVLEFYYEIGGETWIQRVAINVRE